MMEEGIRLDDDKDSSLDNQRQDSEAKLRGKRWNLWRHLAIAAASSEGHP